MSFSFNPITGNLDKVNPPVDISGKQDTLVSGTSIKTVNSTSLLGSGDIVIGSAVDSVNTQTGAVVLDTDDIAEGTNKYVTSAEKTILSNTSGVNTGDQVVPAQFNPIAGSNVTLTGTYPNVTFNSSGGGTWGSITGTLSSQTDLNSALDGKFDKTGGTITQTGSDSGYIDIRSGPTGNRSSFSLTGNGSPNAGDTMTFQMRNDIGDAIAFVYDLSASTYHNFLRFDYLNDKVSFPHMLPFSNLTYGLGSSSAYFANTYTQKLYLNSTAYLDGSTAGQVNITGAVSASNLSGNNTGDQDISGKADVSALTAHTSNTSNPHLVTKSQVGLSNVPNTDFTSAVSANTAKISYTDGTAVAANTSARHTHANKALLDTYTQTEANLADAVAKKHTPVDISGKQDTLVSGTNIKTINGGSVLGSGNITISGGGGASLIIDTKRNILTSTPADPSVALSSDTNEYYAYDGTNWNKQSLPLSITTGVPTGAGLYSDVLGYSEKFIMDKYFVNAFLGTNTKEVDNAIRIDNNQTPSVLQRYGEGQWNTYYPTRVQDGSLKYDYLGYTFTGYSGNSDTVGINGKPLVQQGNLTSGSCGTTIMISGG